jgi:hypothetical protein
MTLGTYREGDAQRFILLESTDGGDSWTPILDPVAGGVGGSYPQGGTPTRSQPSVATSSTTLLASNVNRKFASVQNDSGSTVFVAFGTAATTTDYTVKLVDGAFYEVPLSYTGLITACVAAGSATVRVTEAT